ncbi:MAG TPA: hypothetical protein VIB79_25970 [Candidatus Binatia bacterium]|jgi:hypothetical protein
MEKQESVSGNLDPIVIEHAGMRMAIAHRHGLGGNDEGLTFDITESGADPEEGRILRFDCFYKNPHYHIGRSGQHPVHHMKDEGIDDSVRWTLEQLKTRLPSLVKEAGYGELAEKIDQQSVASKLSQLEQDILARF